EHLDRHDLRAFGDAGERLPSERAVTRRDARYVGAVNTVAQRTRNSRSRTDLFIDAVGTHRLTCAGGCRGVARFLDHFSSEKGMRRIDAAVDDGDNFSGPVEPLLPHLIAFDERHALGQ